MASGTAKEANELILRRANMSAEEVKEAKLTPHQQLEVQLLGKYRPDIERALSKVIDYETLAGALLQEFRINPALYKCTPTSILGAVFTLSKLGLSPGGPLGMAYIIPYNRSAKVNGEWQQIAEAQVIVGYRGMIQLAYRSGQVANIEPFIVYENDNFEWIAGSNAQIIHKPKWGGERGKITGYYIVVTMKDGRRFTSNPWTPEDIEKHRARYAQGKDKKETKMWRENPETASLKTVFRMCARWWPLSTEFMNAIAVDSQTVNVAIDTDHHVDEIISFRDVNDIEGEFVEADIPPDPEEPPNPYDVAAAQAQAKA